MQDDSACPDDGATLSEGHCARRGCDAFSFFLFPFLFPFPFLFLLGASRRPAFLRFRTNDVLLGTLGVGVRICGVSDSPARMEQLPGLDTAARMEKLPGWNNYLGSNLRPQTTRVVTLPIELRGASTGPHI